MKTQPNNNNSFQEEAINEISEDSPSLITRLGAVTAAQIMAVGALGVMGVTAFFTSSVPSSNTSVAWESSLIAGIENLSSANKEIEMYGSAWNDINKNGRQEAGEPTIAGAVIKMKEFANGEVEKLVSDADGNIYSPPMAAGGYNMMITPPEGYELSSITTAKNGIEYRVGANISVVLPKNTKQFLFGLAFTEKAE